MVSQYKLGPLFTPPVVSKSDGPLALLAAPGPLGGANWPGGSFDPDTHMFYVFSQGGVGIYGLIEARSQSIGHELHSGHRSARPDAEARPGRSLNVEGLPLMKPPYGRITRDRYG